MTDPRIANTNAKSARASLIYVLAAVFALGPFATDTYLPALPAMGKALATSTALAQLTVPIFILGIGLGQLVFGPLSDRLGRRPPLMAGILLFSIASVACATCDSIGALLFWRLLQGFGMCSGQAITMALLADLYEPRDMARFTARMFLVGGLAPLVAPLMGGWLLQHSDWRAIFWMLAVYGIVVLLLVYGLIPETRSANLQAHARSESPWASYRAVIGNRRLMRFGCICALSMAAFATYLANASLVYIEGFGVSPQRFGFYFGVNVLGLLAASQLNRALLVRRLPQHIVRWTALAAFACAATLLGASLLGNQAKWAVLTALFVSLAAVMMCVPNAMALAQGEDRKRSGSVASVVGLLQALLAVAASAATSVASNAAPSATATPMAAAMCACALLALALAWRATIDPGKADSRNRPTH